MKKVLIALLMLFVVLGGLFAAEGKQDQVKITATVGGSTEFGFTQAEYTDTKAKNGTDFDAVTDNTITAEDSTVEFYASARTNKNAPISMKIKATGLTRVVDNSYTNDVVKLTINNTDFTTAATSTIESNGVTNEAETTVTFTETVTDVSTLSGYRAFSNKLTISADLSGATAGDYTAFVTLIADAA